MARARHCSHGFGFCMALFPMNLQAPRALASTSLVMNTL
jgi:hypothetical protein